MKTFQHARYRLLAKSWRAYALALGRLNTARRPRLTNPKLSSQTTFRLDWGLLLCLACCSLIGFLLIRPSDPLAPQISTTHLEVPAPHHFDSRYYYPTLGSVHQIQVPGVGWALITYKGIIADLDKLPVNPTLGDTYFCPKVGGYWVWSVLRGQTVPTWVDP
jgi:hypothetical protein